MNLTDIIDISMELNERTVVWKDDPQPQLRPVLRQPEHPVNFTWLDFGAHAGTHIDAPYFLFEEGMTADQIPLTELMGPCQVLDLSEVEETVEPWHLHRLEIDSSRVLLRTQNSLDPMEKYNPEHVALSLSSAQYLLDKGVRLIGYDYQSFERGGATLLHRYLLEREITLLDNLRLADAPAGHYTLLCLPLRVTGIDAAPCRALLLPPA